MNNVGGGIRIWLAGIVTSCYDDVSVIGHWVEPIASFGLDVALTTTLISIEYYRRGCGR